LLLPTKNKLSNEKEWQIMLSSYRPVLFRMMKIGLLIDIGIFIGAFIINRITDWNTLQDYGTILQVLAGLGVVLGMISISGTKSVPIMPGRHRFDYQSAQSAQSASGEEAHERAKRDLADNLENFSFFLQMLVAAILPFLVGMWLLTS
jgi:hypothetical protein